MNFEVVITCAVTGAGDTVGKSDKVPVTPKQIANAAIDAAKAGATSVHIHVRDPETGKGSRDPKLFKETVDRTYFYTCGMLTIYALTFYNVCQLELL